jgi:hypothetical protein
VLTWGRAVAERPDLLAFVRSLAASESAVVRIDLPAGEVIKSPPPSACIVVAAAEDRPVAAQLIGPSPLVDPQVQGQGFLFLIKTNSARLIPGTAVSG